MTDQECSGDLIFNTCGGCRHICDEKPRRCPRKCFRGCFCPAGLYLISSGENRCVEKEDCHKRDHSVEKYYD